MRHSLKNFWILWLCLLLSVFAIKYVSAATVDTWVEILPNEPRKLWYRSNLHTLRMWNSTTNAQLRVGNWKLKISNWLIAGNNSTVTSEYAVIGWWDGNTVSANYAGIGWGNGNSAAGIYAVIGWGNGNTTNWRNAVVVGGESNESAAWSVVVWWKDNKGLNWGVVLWWNNNTANKNSLALWVSSTSEEGWFAWNWSASSKTASVNASNWVLIGTTDKINGVNLVVNWGVKLGWPDAAWWTSLAWEIRAVGGCFYAYDGAKWHIINRWDEKNNVKCTATLDTAKYCDFGNTIVWHWDKVTWYEFSHSVSCTEKNLICLDGKLYVEGTSIDASTYYPYCHVVNIN